MIFIIFFERGGCCYLQIQHTTPFYRAMLWTQPNCRSTSDFFNLEQTKTNVAKTTNNNLVYQSTNRFSDGQIRLLLFGSIDDHVPNLRIWKHNIIRHNTQFSHKSLRRVTILVIYDLTDKERSISHLTKPVNKRLIPSYIITSMFVYWNLSYTSTIVLSNFKFFIGYWYCIDTLRVDVNIE